MLSRCLTYRRIGWLLEGCIEQYLAFTARRPCVVISAWALGAIVFVAVGLIVNGVPELETEFQLRSDGIIADRADSLQVAMAQEMQRRETLERRLEIGSLDVASLSRRLEQEGGQKERWHIGWKVNLYYESVRGDIFDPRVLNDIRTFENRLISLPSYADFCLQSRQKPGKCRGLRSFMRFLHGTRTLVLNTSHLAAYEVDPDGAQDERNDKAQLLAAMQMQEKWERIDEPTNRLWYFDVRFPKSRLLRSTAAFGLPLRGFAHKHDRRGTQQSKFAEFVHRELYPCLRGASTDHVRIYFDGCHELFEHEVRTAVIEDAQKAIASLLLVYICMAIYTRAPLVALFGMTTMILSVPVGMVLFTLTGHPTLPAINFLALFLMTGIGADNLFILIDAWRQTKRDYRNLKSRLRLTFARAGTSLTACGTTTAVSFLANMLSSVRPLRWFGTFVGLCVIANLFLCLAMFPPLLLLRERTKRRKVKVDNRVSSSTLIVVTPGPTAWTDKPDAIIRARPVKTDRLQWLGCFFRCPRIGASFKDPSRADIMPMEMPKRRTKRLKRGEHYHSELCAPEDEKGREVPFNCFESFFGNIYAPMLRYLHCPIVCLGLVVFVLSCILVSQHLAPSREYPTLFAPGTHNLGDVAAKKNEFGNVPFTSQMEIVPLRICDGCNWNQDCEWSAWSAWDVCGGCVRLTGTCDICRSRSVNVPRGPGGIDCIGNHSENKPCDHACFDTQVPLEPVTTTRASESEMALMTTTSTSVKVDSTVSSVTWDDISKTTNPLAVDKFGTQRSSTIMSTSTVTPIVAHGVTKEITTTTQPLAVAKPVTKRALSTTPTSTYTPSAMLGATAKSTTIATPLAVAKLGPQRASSTGFTSTFTPKVTLGDTVHTTTTSNPLGVAKLSARRASSTTVIPALTPRDTLGATDETTITANPSGVAQLGPRSSASTTCTPTCTPTVTLAATEETKTTAKPLAIATAGPRNTSSTTFTPTMTSTVTLQATPKQRKNNPPFAAALQELAALVEEPRNKQHDPRAAPLGLAHNVTKDQVVRVDVVFGFKRSNDGRGELEGFDYDNSFDLGHIDTQIFLSRLCRKIRESGNSYAVREVVCLFDAFQDWLKENNLSFPVMPGHRLHGLLDEFISSSPQRRSKWQSHVGFSKGHARFIKLEALTNLLKHTPSVDAWVWYLRWDDFVGEVNAELELISRGTQCFHTSNLWVRADAERQLVDSTIACAIASVTFAMVVVFLFLESVLLTVLVVTTILCIIMALGALMFAVYGWSFGAIEAVALIIVVGFSVDYALHIAESYNQSSCSTRYLRVQDALRRTGGALLGAALTSVLACPPILFCTIQIFTQFGLTLISNMLLAIFFSLSFFAASLVAIGPMLGPRDCLPQACIRWSSHVITRHASQLDLSHAVQHSSDTRSNSLPHDHEGHRHPGNASTSEHLSAPTIVATLVFGNRQRTSGM